MRGTIWESALARNLVIVLLYVGIGIWLWYLFAPTIAWWQCSPDNASTRFTLTPEIHQLVGVPRRAKTPLYFERGGKSIGNLGNARRYGMVFECNQLDSGEQWVQLSGNSPASILGAYVRRTDMSFAPADILRYYRENKRNSRGTAFENGAGTSRIEIKDFNGDGQLEVLRDDQIWRDNHPVHAYVLYGMRHSLVVPYFALQLDEGSALRSVSLADGSTGFSYAPLIWWNQAYVWQAGRPQLVHDAGLLRDREKRDMAHNLWPPNLLLLLLGCAPAITLIWLLYPMAMHPRRRRWAAVLALLVIALVVGANVGFFHRGPSQADLVVPTLPLLLGCLVVLLAAVSYREPARQPAVIRLHSAKRGPKTRKMPDFRVRPPRIIPPSFCAK